MGFLSTSKATNGWETRVGDVNLELDQSRKDLGIFMMHCIASNLSLVHAAYRQWPCQKELETSEVFSEWQNRELPPGWHS